MMKETMMKEPMMKETMMKETMMKETMMKETMMKEPARTFLSTFALWLAAACVIAAPITDVQASPYHHPVPSLITDDMAGGGEEVEGEVDAGAEVEADEPVATEGPEDVSAPQPEPKKGLGMLITGGVITGLYALPMSIYGTAIIVASRRAANSENDVEQVGGALGGALGGVILGFGIVGLAVGAPLLGVGASRFSRWRKWKADNQVALAPSVGRTAIGTYTPGVTLRF